MGITILPEVTASRHIAEGRMAALRWVEGKPEVATLMLWHKDKWLSPALIAFMQEARDVMAA